VKHVTRKPSRQDNEEEYLEEDPDKPGKGIKRNTECKRNKKKNQKYPKSVTGNNIEETTEGGQDKPGTTSVRTGRRMNRMEYERHM
jgi:hypothetical protein